MSREISKLHEEKVADILKMIDCSAEKVKNSGACDFNDGDVKFTAGLVECKTMKEPQKQQTIKKEDLEKIDGEAFRSGLEMGIMSINFGDIMGKEYFIIQENDFMNIMYAYLKEEGYIDG